MEQQYTPPFTMTDRIIEKISEISELVGRITAWQDMNANPKLRRENRIKTIHSSLAIENNSLSLDQVTAIINGKRILGEPREIQEVKNAFEAYERLLSFDPYSAKDLLTAHHTLMNELVREAGMFRSGGVGVYKGEQLVHHGSARQHGAGAYRQSAHMGKNFKGASFGEKLCFPLRI